MHIHPDLVSKLYFGRDAAERDMADGLLGAGFLRTQAYEAALSGRKTLVIGRKGSGKSAICMQLAEGDQQASRTALITPDDAAGDELRRFELQGLTMQTAKSLVWRYVFAIQAARYLVTHSKDAHGKKSASVAALSKFLHANGEGDVDERFYDRVISGISRLQTSISLEAFGVKASLDIKGQSEGAIASKQLDIIERGVAKAFTELACAKQHDPFVILVDQLEEVWSADLDSNAMVNGLLIAGQHVSGRLYGGALRCILFLRSDIYDSLDFGEGDKFHSDEMRIDWTARELCEVALARARASTGVALTDAQMWMELFPGQVSGENVQDYILRRTLPRPRDVIQFLNQCRDKAGDRRHERITEQDVVDATQQFSEWKLRDLSKEYKLSYPYLEDLYVIFQNTGYIVMRGALQARLDAHLEVLRQKYADYVQIFTAHGVLGILYSVGFLGVKRGGDVVYSGRGHAGIQPSENEFHIHPCFRPALNVTRPIELRSYESINFDIQAGTLVGGFLFQGIAGRDISVKASREAELLDSLVRSCDLILARIGRSDLPEDTRAQVSDELGRILSAAATQRAALRAGASAETVRHVIKAAGYLNSLAGQLVQNGATDADQGMRVVQTIRDEASGLIREAGGGRRT
jgi:hypothetical protein